MKTYSYSKIACFEQCPLKFKFRYIDRVPVDFEHTIEQYVGTMAHKTLEKLYSDLRNFKLNLLPGLLDYLVTEWKNNWKQDILIVKKDLTQEDYLKMAVQFVSDYYHKYFPFNKSKTIATEHKINLKLDDETLLIGYIDRLDSKDNIFSVHDYKTGKFLPPQEQLDQDKQLALYALAVKDQFNANEIKLQWHFLAHNQTLESKRTNEQLEQLKQETIQIIKVIEATKEFAAKPSRLCDWCEYGDGCEKKSES